MLPAARFGYLITSTLFFLSFISETCLAVTVTSVVAATGANVIHPNDKIKISWTAEAQDPPRFDVNLRFPNGNSLLLLKPDVPVVSGGVTVSVRNIPAPASYTIFMTVFGNPVATNSVSFNVEPADVQTPTAIPPPASGESGPSTTTSEATDSPASPTTSNALSDSYTTPTDATVSATSNTLLKTPSTTSAANSGVSAIVTSESAIPTLTSISTDASGHAVTILITATSDPRTSATASSQSGASKHSSAGAIAGGVVGALALLAIVAAVALWIARRRKRKMAPSQMFRWLSRQNRAMYDAEMRQTTQYRVDGIRDRSDAALVPPPAYSSVHAWLGKVKPPDRADQRF